MEYAERLKKIANGDLIISSSEVLKVRKELKQSLYNAKETITNEKYKPSSQGETNTKLINEFAELVYLLEQALKQLKYDHPNILTEQEVADNRRAAKSKEYRGLVYNLRGM